MKIVLDDIASGYQLSKINANFQKIEDELNNKVLYRDNPEGEPNVLQSDLDANGFGIYNLDSISLQDGESLRDLVDEAATSRDEAVDAKEVTEILEAAMSVLFLGAKSSDPITDNNGNSLSAGSLYLLTTGTPKVRVYNGAMWQDVGTYTSITTTSIDAALYASQLEAEQGINDAKVVTPLKVKQSIAAEVGESVQAYDATILKSADIGGSVQAYDADTAKTDIKQNFTAQQTPMNGSLTDGATINWNADTNGQVVKVTLGGNRTMAAPTNIVENTSYMLRVKQDGTGSRTLTWDSAYKFGGSGAPTLTTTANKVDWLSFIGGASNTLEYLGIRKNAV